MGISNLGRVIKCYSTKLDFEKDLSGSYIGIDVSNYLYKATYKADTKGTNPHIRAFFEKIVICHRFGIVPVFIFDGSDDLDCKVAINDRRKTRVKNLQEILISVKKLIKKHSLIYSDINKIDMSTICDGKSELAISTSLITAVKFIEKKIGEKHTDIDSVHKRTSRIININSCMIDDLKKLFELTGVPYLQAKGEADILLGQLSNEGLIDGVFSKDTDMLTYGVKYLYRDFFDMQFHRKREITRDSISEILKGLDINFASFVDLCLMLGSDLHRKGIPKVGPKTAVEYITKYKNIKTILKKVPKLKIDSDFNYVKFRKLFARSGKPSGLNKDDIIYYEIDDEDELKNFLTDKVNYMPKTILKKIKILTTD